MFDGILNMNKPAGISSFSFMRQVQRKLALKKVGFLGTLDPLASGVLVLLCGKATKLADKLHAATTQNGGNKVYRAVFTFGIETDTLDSAGTVIARSDKFPSLEGCREAAGWFVGDIEIEVPRFSAVHIGGKRAYDIARRGVDFTPPKRIVNIKRFEQTTPSPTEPPLQGGEFMFEVECETGTYIRSLAKLLAARLGTVAIASSIHRTRVGEFDISTAKTLDEVTINDLLQV